jgi:hypothetical protein
VVRIAQWVSLTPSLRPRIVTSDFRLAGGGDQHRIGAVGSALDCLLRRCCSATHVEVGDTVSGGWEAQLGSTGPPCDYWQFASLDDVGNAGCWVGVRGQNRPQAIAWSPSPAPGIWIGAEGCTRPRSTWGGHFLLAFVLGLSLYLAAGTAWGKWRGGRGRGGLGGRFGPLSAHPHVHIWLGVARLCADGIAYARQRGGGTSGVMGRHANPAGRGSGDRDKRPGKDTPKTMRKPGRKHSKQKADAGSKRERLLEAPAQPPVADGPALLPPTAARDTAAGGGGRWMHVPE